MKKIMFIVLAIIVNVIVTEAQTPAQNLEKYWKYREKLKNFVLPGQCHGCSIPAGGRDGQRVGSNGNSVSITWNDATGEMGTYISFLATEYKLLSDHGLDVTNTSYELWNALETLNRLDYYADYYWDQKWNGSGNPQGSLNGFLIRSDVNADFFEQVYNNNLVENQFNNSLFPPLDNYRTSGWADDNPPFPCKVGSAVTTNLTSDCNFAAGHNLGPEEMSQDHLVNILNGLGLVVKLVPHPLSYNSTPFMDGSIAFGTEAKNIINRIISFAKNQNFPHRWSFINPITGYPVQGVNFHTDQCDGNNFTIGGADLKYNSFGFATGASYLNGEFNTTASLQYFISHFATDGDVSNSAALYASWENHATVPNNEDYKTLLLGAVGNLWGNNTQSVLGKRFDSEYDGGAQVHVPQAPLLNAIFHNVNCVVPNSVYECMLNTASCDDINGHNSSYEWSNGASKYLYGPNTEGTSYSDQISTLGYLYYFNLYNIYNPQYLNSSYQVIDPKHLLYTDITKQDYIEHDEKNFYAAHSVTFKGNTSDYTISNDNNPNQSPLYRDANVTSKSGDFIAMLPGFSVELGATFSANTDPNLSAISCENTTPVDAPCTACGVGLSEKNPGNQAGDMVTKVIKAGNDLLALTAHAIFKIREHGGLGPKMFGIGHSTNACDTFNLDGKYYVEGYQDIYGDNLGDLVQGYVEDAVYDNGYTYLSLYYANIAKNYIVKINGNGDLNMNRQIFGINPTHLGQFDYNQSGPIVGIQEFSAALGTAKLQMENNNLLLIFDKTLVKIGNLSGTGTNMFDVSYSNSSQLFSFGASTASSSGAQEFDGGITEVAYVNGKLFVATKNGIQEKGKLLKVNGLGGTGNNMFAVAEQPNSSSDAFNNIPSFFYYAGDAKFESFVTKIADVNGSLMLGFKDSRMLKVLGTGGTGHNMFNVVESTDGFDNWSNTFSQWMIGSQRFRDPLINGFNELYVTDIDYYNGSTYISCHDGKMLRVSGTGGSGYNMFNVVPDNNYGFTTFSTNYFVYMQGCSDFNVSVKDFEVIDNYIFLSLYPGTLLKLSGCGTGDNMFALAYQDEYSFKSVCGYEYYQGCEDFTDMCNNSGGNRLVNYQAAPNTDTIRRVITPELQLKIIPNPNAGVFTLHAGETISNADVELFDMLGNVVFKKQFTKLENEEISISTLNSGIYYIHITGEGGMNKVLKVIKE